MASWQSAVRHPLGLAGFALACVFSLIARFGPTIEYPWLMPLAATMAAVALIGGLLIASRQRSRSGTPSHNQSSSAAPAEIQITTTGDQSPAIGNANGKVSINYGASPERGDKEQQK